VITLRKKRGAVLNDTLLKLFPSEPSIAFSKFDKSWLYFIGVQFFTFSKKTTFFTFSNWKTNV
jgi:hypothetical protein